MSKAKINKKGQGFSVQAVVILLVLLLVAITLCGQHFLGVRAKQLQASGPAPLPVPSEMEIYLVRLSPSGEVHLEPVIVMIPLGENALVAPMTRLVEVTDTGSEGLRSFLPAGTQLLEAKQVGDRLYLDFNEAFRFNPLGYDAYIAQLKQVIYTATQNLSVKEVRILIEGKEVDFLNDGVYIGDPLTRASWDDENSF